MMISKKKDKLSTIMEIQFMRFSARKEAQSFESKRKNALAQKLLRARISIN